LKNRILWVAALFYFILLSARSRAEDSIYVNVGSARPSNPSGFSDNWNAGGNFGVGFGFGLSPAFQLVVDANGYNFPVNSSRYLTVSGGEYRDGLLLVNGRLKFIAEDNPVVAYGILGIGVSTLTQDAMTSTTSGGSAATPASSTTSLAGRLGVGIDIKLSGYTSLFLEFDGIGNKTIDYGSGRLGGKFNL
jgi:hypothetical protein